MAPHFETAKSFADVPINDDGVDTATFLEASDGLVQMFELLGSGIFGFVQNDIRNNVAGVRDRYSGNKEGSTTLENLVRTEVEEGHRFATACLVRLIRGLTFTCRALQHTQKDPPLKLHVCFKRSYDEVLRHQHSFVIRSVVSVAIRAVPHRHDFYQRIAQGGSTEKLNLELDRWLAGLNIVIKRITEFLEQGKFGNV
jgi:hypothetical protein